jgi:triacylglycerol lipase
MSTLVSFPIEIYRQFGVGAFKGFAPTAPRFAIGNARALMWFAQLAYEIDADKDEKIALTKGLWGFEQITPFEAKNDHRYDTHGLIGIRGDAVVLAFCGTDPLVFDTILTDARFPLNNEDVHTGFAEAAAAPQITDSVRKAIAATQRTNGPARPLLIAGHSLGAAIASLAALHAAAVEKHPPAGVYTYGMPRTGGAIFKKRYEGALDDPASLGNVTYRLVNGPDIVPAVSPPLLGYLHVGRLLRCGTNTPFDPQKLLATTASDDPIFEPDVLEIVKSFLSIIKLVIPKGPGPLGLLFKLLPAGIRDHLQDQYLAALGFNIEF